MQGLMLERACGGRQGEWTMYLSMMHAGCTGTLART